MATTIQRVLDREDTVAVEIDPEESTLVQTGVTKKQVKDKDKQRRSTTTTTSKGETGKKKTGLSEEKKAKLLQSSAKSQDEVTKEQRLESLMETLRSAMDHMKTQESRACAQAFLQRLLIHYFGYVLEDMPAGLPLEAEMVVASFVACGAEVGREGEALTPQDNYFVNHWWNMIQPLLPERPQGVPSVIVDPTPSTLPATEAQASHSGQGNVDASLGAVWDRLMASAVPTQDIDEEGGDRHEEEEEESHGEENQEMDKNEEGEEEAQFAKMDEHHGTTAEQPVQIGTVAGSAVGPLEPGHGGGGQCGRRPDVANMEGSIDAEDLLAAAVAMEASIYRDWEEWIMKEAVPAVPMPGTRCRVAGQVFQGGQAVSPRQSLDFQLAEGRELRLSMLSCPALQPLGSPSSRTQARVPRVWRAR